MAEGKASRAQSSREQPGEPRQGRLRREEEAEEEEVGLLSRESSCSEREREREREEEVAAPSSANGLQELE